MTTLRLNVQDNQYMIDSILSDFPDVEEKYGKLYKEKNFPNIINPGLAEQQITLGKNEYFVLGDNRNNSEDSRFTEVQNVNAKYIEGKIWLQISPSKKPALIK